VLRLGQPSVWVERRKKRKLRKKEKKKKKKAIKSCSKQKVNTKQNKTKQGKTKSHPRSTHQSPDPLKENKYANDRMKRRG
jgi:hypothetical protein